MSVHYSILMTYITSKEIFQGPAKLEGDLFATKKTQHYFSIPNSIESNFYYAMKNVIVYVLEYAVPQDLILTPLLLMLSTCYY